MPDSIRSRKPCRLGTHRVIDPPGVLPQTAWKLDASPRVHENEILCDVDLLNIDSASFRQISEACENDPQRIAEHITSNVRERGKQHNPVTGSGGMFIGRVREIGADVMSSHDLKPGDRIASLVSLTLTPLTIERVHHVALTTASLSISGTAILFESGIYAQLPDDIPDSVALAVLDVAGAPAQIQKLAQPKKTILVIGADGKSGLLACVQARESVGPQGRVLGVVPNSASVGAQLLQEQGYVDALIEVDARDPIAMENAVTKYAPELADLVVNCVNVPGTEMGSILCAREGATVYFFSMSTSFTAAALGAEGVGKDITMIIGNGYTKGHAANALQLLRNHPALMRYFLQRFRSPQENG